MIREPEGKGKHYAEWKAEHDGKPTVRDGIRKDIDDAISQSMTWSHFAGVMQEKGYVFKLYRQDGDLLAHPGIIPPESEKAFRLDGLGERYTLDAISDRIIENTRPVLPFAESETTHKRAKTVRPKKKLHGLYALYIRYCYELHIIVKHPRNKPLHMELRADAVKLKKLDEQTRFLARYGITNLDELAAHKAATEKLHEALREEQHITANSRKALKRRGDEEGLKALDKERASRTAKLRELFREEKLCDEIAARSEEIRQRLELAGEYRKEISEDEYIRGCGRAGRENESGSDRGRG